MHVLLGRLLGKEYDLIHAKNAQEGINVISEKPVNLILSDIHMPGLSGLKFLESLMQDADKKDIPVLIMTNLPTVEKEQKALLLSPGLIFYGTFIPQEMIPKYCRGSKEETKGRESLMSASVIVL